MGKIEELLVNKGLYDSVDITVDDLDEIEKCLTKDEYAGNTIDCFCVHSLLAEKERKSKEKIFEKFVAKKTGELK